MAETTSEQDQKKKSEQAGEPARPQPAVEAPQPELEGPQLSLSVGPGLGSPDGFEKRVGDSVLRRNANRQPRAQTLTAMQRQFGNQHVRRFMVQRRAANGIAVVQREEKTDGGTKAPAKPYKLDETGVTTAVYSTPTFTTKDEKADPARPPKDVQPDDDLVTLSGTAVVVFQATVTITLPTVPDELKECEKKIVADAIKNKLAPHEKQHEAAMKTYDGTVNEKFKVTGVKRADIPTALNTKAQEIADRLQKERQKSAQDKSNQLDPFVVSVMLDCDDKPEKKDTEGAAGEQAMAGGEATPSGAAGESAPAEPA